MIFRTLLFLVFRLLCSLSLLDFLLDISGHDNKTVHHGVAAFRIKNHNDTGIRGFIGLTNINELIGIVKTTELIQLQIRNFANLVFYILFVVLSAAAVKFFFSSGVK